MNCRVTYKDDNFTCLVDFQNRLLPKKAGFRWDTTSKRWYTSDYAVAARLREYADTSAKKEINRILLTVSPSPWTKPLTVPSELTLMPHQVEAAHFALTRNRSYLGLDPGLGKTIVAAVIAATLKRKTVYICPPFATRNTENEFKKWAPGLATYRYVGIPHPYADVLIVPDSIITRREVQADIFLRFTVREVSPLLFIDEAHRFKNDEAQRTRALFKSIVDGFTTHVYMSGTPMPSRPMELYPVLTKAAPQTIDFMNRFSFGKRYCAGYHDGFGWNFDGASNMPELRNRVIAPTGPFMLRQKKHLLNLPPKIEELFVVEDKMPMKLASLDADIGKKYHAGADVIREKIIFAEGKDLHDATYRRLLGVEKVPYAVTYLKHLMEETSDNVLVFAHHREVIEKLTDSLSAYKPFSITGDTPMAERQRLVDLYQKNTEPRMFIGNYQSMGTAFTLTKATRVLFVEFSWVPGDNEQASDRAHRIGQNNSVLVQYMVYADSYDKLILEANLQKKKALYYV